MNSTDRAAIASSFNRAQAALASERANVILVESGIPSESEMYRITREFAAASGAPEPVIFEAMVSVWADAEAAAIEAGEIEVPS